MARDRQEGRRCNEQWTGQTPRLGPREARALFDAVTDYRVRPYRFFEEALAPGMDRWSGFAGEYARYRRLASAPGFEPPSVRNRNSPWSELWTFYALSRLFEWLVAAFQDRAGLVLPPDWPGRRARFNTAADDPRMSPSREELLRFFAAFGMAPIQVHTRYHPFFHEIAAAEPEPALGEAILVEEEVWPGLWFGDMVFARAGVRVRYGPDAPFDAVAASRSTLFFAWSRVHRPTFDLSHGWGSSSQWATSFRRDYTDGTMLHYNVDGWVRLSDDASLPVPAGRFDEASGVGMTRTERIGLLRHRCFPRVPEPEWGFWLFDDTYAEPAPGPDWIW